MSGRGRASRVTRREEALKEEAPSRPFPFHGGSRCLPPAAWSRGGLAGASRQHPSAGGRGLLGVSGSRPQGGHTSDITAVPASLESVKASNVHACPRSRCPGQQDGASSHCPFPSTPQDCVGRPWSVGYWPQDRPRSPAGAKVPRAMCGLRASALLPGLKAEREAMLTVQGATWGLNFYASDTLSVGQGFVLEARLCQSLPLITSSTLLSPASGVGLEPGRHPISGRSQPRAGSLQAALGCGQRARCEVRPVSLCLSHCLWNLCFFTCEMWLYKAQINLEWEDASASVWNHTSLLVPRTMGAR